jgi:predicted nucleic acid-binding protein
MTANPVAFDTWAWWEVLHATPTGEKLAKKYLEAPGVRVVTADLALVELSAKLAREGRADEIHRALAAVEAASEVVPISLSAAEASGPLLVELRKVNREASLADAVMLAVARGEGARLISGDQCFAGQKDVASG